MISEFIKSAVTDIVFIRECTKKSAPHYKGMWALHNHESLNEDLKINVVLASILIQHINAEKINNPGQQYRSSM